MNLKENLKRYPADSPGSRGPLQAWDAADELALNYFSETFQAHFAGKNPRVLILNDYFGAISATLKVQRPELDVTTYTDSYLSFKAIQLNSEDQVKPVTRLQELSGFYDLVLIRVPKNMSFFEDMLCHLTSHLKPGAKIVCGYMIKYQSKTSFDLLNRIIGETTTSLAKKKARLIFCDFQKSKVASPYPAQLSIKDLEQSFDIPFVNHSNLFSREKLDIGTRFLLEHIPEGEFTTILDLGCGNGIIGLAAKMANPEAQILFIDESEMAIQSAQANYENYFPKAVSADPQFDPEFEWTHCYRGEKSAFVDLVLCNPPFHQGNAVSDETAWQMFKDSHRALKKGGILRVVGNSQLFYQNAIKKIFGNSATVAKNSKFTIVDSVKQ
jgi:23S rRNA (guanine1835-N2)-methyltransferase